MRLSVIATIIALSGCIHPIGVTHQQACARQGQIVDQISVGDSQSATCKPAETEEQQCEIKAHLQSLKIRSSSNGNCCGFQNTIVGVGYVFYILPGALFYYIFDKNQEGVIRDSNELDVELVKECSASDSVTH